MADFPGKAEIAFKHFPVHKNATADTLSDRHVNGGSLGQALVIHPVLAQCTGIGIVNHHHRKIERLFQVISHRLHVPHFGTGHEDDFLLDGIERTGDGNTYRQWLI